MAHNICGDNMRNIFKYIPPKETVDFDLTFGKTAEKVHRQDMSKVTVSEDIEKTYSDVKSIVHSDINGDIKIRHFVCHTTQDSRRGFLVWVDGLVNTTMLNDFILRPLMDFSFQKENFKGADISFFVENVIHQGAIAYKSNLTDLVGEINTGNAVLFLQGCTMGVSFDIKTWEHRGIDTPLNEAVIEGPHEGFNEVLRCNSALIRKTINSSDLVMQTFFLGTKSKTPASLAYIDGIINPSLLAEIQNRLSSIKTDYVLSSFDIEKMLEEKSLIPMQQILSTERPDKVSRALIEGRAALLLNGSSKALILPSNITDIISSPEDAYLRRPNSVFIKLIRIIAVLLSLFTPALYLSMTIFHSEAILTNMLITLWGASRNIAFSPLTEVIIMELAFELIKEAGVRIPGAIGSSLGIVGGLILGQSAVSAGLVSPIVIIIVSVCGIASFAIPSYSLSFSFRISRFVYILAGAFLGIVGIVSLACVHLSLVLGIKSFGVPICVPFSPVISKHPIMHALFDNHYKIKPPSYLKANCERKENK